MRNYELGDQVYIRFNHHGGPCRIIGEIVRTDPRGGFGSEDLFYAAYAEAPAGQWRDGTTILSDPAPSRAQDQKQVNDEQ